MKHGVARIATLEVTRVSRGEVTQIKVRDLDAAGRDSDVTGSVFDTTGSAWEAAESVPQAIGSDTESEVNGDFLKATRSYSI